jgi:L-histidine Nalpha-methyltransferase
MPKSASARTDFPRETRDSETPDEDPNRSRRPQSDGNTSWMELDESASKLDFATSVRAGLGTDPKTVPSQYFYDAEGSRLFEEICALPEYYLTRAESEILGDAAVDLAHRLPKIRTLVELGSGSSTKTEALLRAFESDRLPLCYTPIDVSRSALVESVSRLEEKHPRLEIVAAVAEYASGLAAIQARELGPSLTLWLGSSIGNLERPAASDFLGQIRDSMRAEDRFLVGIDLRKDRRILEEAYDDAQGVTARFNLNLLARINRELGAEFDLNRFRHRVHYDESTGSVQSFLESQSKHTVRIADLDLTIHFEEGERIHTEDSHKYSVEEIDSLALGAGLSLEKRYLDRAGHFTLNLFRPTL